MYAYEIPAYFSTGYGNLIMYNFENGTSKSDKRVKNTQKWSTWFVDEYGPLVKQKCLKEKTISLIDNIPYDLKEICLYFGDVYLHSKNYT